VSGWGECAREPIGGPSVLRLIRRAVTLARMLQTFGQAARSSPEIRKFAGLQLQNRKSKK